MHMLQDSKAITKMASVHIYAVVSTGDLVQSACCLLSCGALSCTIMHDAVLPNIAGMRICICICMVPTVMALTRNPHTSAQQTEEGGASWACTQDIGFVQHCEHHVLDDGQQKKESTQNKSTL